MYTIIFPLQINHLEQSLIDQPLRCCVLILSYKVPYTHSVTAANGWRKWLSRWGVSRDGRGPWAAEM